MIAEVAEFDIWPISILVNCRTPPGIESKGPSMKNGPPKTRNLDSLAFKGGHSVYDKRLF